MNQIVLDALRLLFANDAFLLEANVAERAIAAKLAGYLEQYFPAHQVDVEYNRHGLDSKMIELPENCRGGGRKLIYPDIIVHQRGNDDENLLVIQVKKETNREPRACDHSIIVAMKEVFRYRQGLLLELPAGAGAAARVPQLEWV